MDYFNSMLSLEDLRNLYSDYSKEVHGFRMRANKEDGRCTLAALLEGLDSCVASMSNEQKQREGWL